VVDRFFPKASWLPWALPICAKAIRRHRPDVLLTSSPPHYVHLLGLLLKRCYGVPWVADFRDPWVAPARPGKRSSRVKGWASYWEDAVARNANAVIANTPRLHACLAKTYPRHASKVVTLTNGYDPERFQPSPGEPARDGLFRILHAGELYDGRDPRPFLD